MLTFEITICITYRGTSLTNLSLLMSLAAIEGLDIGVGVGLQRSWTGICLAESIDDRYRRSLCRILYSCQLLILK